MRKGASADGRDRRRPVRSSGALPGRSLSGRPLFDSPEIRRETMSGEGIPGHLGAQLRALYQKTLEEPVPDRFLELLRRSDAGSEAPAEPALDKKALDEKT